MKRHFGNLFTRLAWGGTTLTPIEHAVLRALVEALPHELRLVVEAQFDAYNLVQREFDGRALNFYRKKDGKPNNMTGLPMLKQQQREDAPLIRIKALVGTSQEPLHAVLTAVGGRAFCVSFNRSIGWKERAKPIQIEKVVQAWRSNFEATATTPNPAVEGTRRDEAASRPSLPRYVAIGLKV